MSIRWIEVIKVLAAHQLAIGGDPAFVYVPVWLRKAMIAEANEDRAYHGGVPFGEQYDFFVLHHIKVVAEENSERIRFGI